MKHSLWAVLLLTGMAGAALARLPNMTAPPGRDSGAFLYRGARVLAGDLPYRDMWDHKPPGVYYLNAVGLAAGGGHLAGVRGLELLWAGLTALAAFALASQGLSRRAALAAALLSVVFANMPGLVEDGNFTESWVLLPTLAGLACLVKAWREQRHGWALLAGIGLGAALLVRQTAVVVLVAAALWLVLVSSGRKRWLMLAALGVGVSLPLLVLVAYFQRQDGLRDLLDQALVYNFAYAGQGLRAGAVRALLLRSTGVLGWIAPLVALAVVGLRSRAGRVARGRPLRLLALLWLLAAALAVAASGRYYPHYFIELVPALGLLAGLGLADGLAADEETKRWQLAVLGVLIALPSLNWLRDTADALARARVGSPARSQLLATIVEASRPDESILIWGADDALYFSSERRAASRYTYKFPLLREHSGDYASEERRAEFLAEVRREQPAVVVVDLGGKDEASVTREMRDMGLQPLLRQHYARLPRISHYLVYGRQAVKPPHRWDPS